MLLQSRVLKQALAPYCVGGAFGRLLDAEAEQLGDGRIQAFETEGLTGSAAAPAVLSYLFHRIERRLDGAPIVIDVTLAALFWSWGEGDDIIARLIKKTLFVGAFA